MYESKILSLDTQFLLHAQQDCFVYHYKGPLTVQRGQEKMTSHY